MPFPIEKVLAGVPQVKKEGHTYLIPEELDATAFVALGHEVLQVPRILRAELGSEVLLQTHKGERFYFAAELIVGLRLGGPEVRSRHGGAGFGA